MLAPALDRTQIIDYNRFDVTGRKYCLFMTQTRAEEHPQLHLMVDKGCMRGLVFSVFDVNGYLTAQKFRGSCSERVGAHRAVDHGVLGRYFGWAAIATPFLRLNALAL
jgi:hypothetical protein